VKACAQQQPDVSKRFVLNNGVIVPIGGIVSMSDKKKYDCYDNEFIVYDASQVKIRYIVEVII